MNIHARTEGLTLVEVLMGVVILGMAVAPAALILGGDLQGLEVREQATRSLCLAQETMEKLRVQDFDALPDGGSFSGWVTSPDSVYVQVVVTSNPGGAFDANLKKIQVTVGPTTLVTYKANTLEP